MPHAKQERRPDTAGGPDGREDNHQQQIVHSNKLLPITAAPATATSTWTTMEMINAPT